jgi:hypothetical protein
MLTTCSEPGCATLVLGGRCVEHERRPTRSFVRGRPFAASPLTEAAGSSTGTFATTVPERTLELHDPGSGFALPRR